MEEATFKKDETPYLIFTCRKCSQYMYVKTTQKGKKCLRCGQNHIVSDILDSGKIVKGMTSAVEEVKKKQNEFAISELGNTPEFRAMTDFRITGFSSQFEEAEQNESEKKQEDYSIQFTAMLKEISLTYDRFPDYVFDVMADKFKIPQVELRLLEKEFLKKGILKKIYDRSYTINL
ncbi:MAG: hypothetical protein ACFFA3_10660 [Promethearchaeota archaeon]